MITKSLLPIILFAGIGNAAYANCNFGVEAKQFEQGLRVGRQQAENVFRGDCQNMDYVYQLARPSGSSCVEQGMAEGITDVERQMQSQCTGSGSQPGECQVTGETVGGILAMQVCNLPPLITMTTCSLISAQECKVALMNEVNTRCPNHLNSLAYQDALASCDALLNQATWP